MRTMIAATGAVDRVKTIKNILVGVDFSAPSLRALDVAARHAARHRAALSVAHVLTEGGRAQAVHSAAVTHLRDLCRARCAAVADCRVEVKEAEPVAGLRDIADRHSADLIVLASRGLTADESTPLGSTPWRLAVASQRNLLVVRAPIAGATTDATADAPILLATDFALQSRRAVPVVKLMAGPEQSIELLHCVDLGRPVAADLGAGNADDQLLSAASAEALATARRTLAARCSALSTGQKSVAGEVIIGAAGPSIVERASLIGADLLVVGSHGRRGFRADQLGSVAEACLRYAKCSVMVVQPGPLTTMTMAKKFWPDRLE